MLSVSCQAIQKTLKEQTRLHVNKFTTDTLMNCVCSKNSEYISLNFRVRRMMFESGWPFRNYRPFLIGHLHLNPAKIINNHV